MLEERLDYLGNVGLIQYGVDRVVSQNTTTSDGKRGIEVTVVLSRQLLYQLMTAFLPCVVISAASFTTSFYDVRANNFTKIDWLPQKHFHLCSLPSLKPS